MNKQQILEEIDKTKEHLASMEKLLDECEYERWKPADGERYYFLDTYGSISSDGFCSSDYFASQRYQHYNCFQTREQAEQEAEKILIRRQLESIARRLNKGEYIDWGIVEKKKYYLFYCTINSTIAMTSIRANKVQGTIYCLDEKFGDVAVKEIGKERLIKYLRGE